MPHLYMLWRRGSVALLLIVATLASPLSAQDRGALWFPPSHPGDTLQTDSVYVGQTWGVTQLPTDRWERRYDVQAGADWKEHLSRGALRLPECSAALGSPRGLALTTARCLRTHLEAVEADTLTGRVLEEEHRVPGLYADRLVETRDVTQDVRAEAGTTAVLSSHLATVREQIQAQMQEGTHVEIVAEAGGTQYTAYVYRRYKDLRLVFLPEMKISAFGGLEEALTYPRHALDVALFRIYTNGTPLETEHYFDVRSQGVRPGDPVFGIGHPPTTHRSETSFQIMYRRDVLIPDRLSQIETWVSVATPYLDTLESSASHIKHQLREAQRKQKALRLQRKGLQKQAVMTRLQRRDEIFRRILNNRLAPGRSHGGLLDSLSALQQAKRRLTPAYRAFGSLEDSPFASATLRRAILGARIRDTSGAARNRLMQQLAEIPPQPAALDQGLLASQLETLRSYFEGDSVLVRTMLNGASPAARAASIVETSLLAQPDRFIQKVRTGELSAGDPALTLAEAIQSPYDQFQDEWEELRRKEKRLTERITRARRAVRDSSVLLPVNRGPRITDGRVQGVPYNGTRAAPFTTYYGLFAQHHGFKGGGPWDLPDTWTSSEALDRSQVLNIASSTDRAGGMEGAPLLNQYLELVGLTFAGNVQGTLDPFLFLPSHMRSVSVDLRGLREALTTIYEAEALLEELFGQPSPPRDTSP